MARLGGDLKATVTYQGEAVVFSLRPPTNKELNKFLAARWETDRKLKMKDRTHEARCKFFDLLFIGVENLEDKDGNPVTPDNKELIPSNWKSDIIFNLFEDSEVEVNEKN